ncbi:MAG: flagellar motor protein MotB, partial [Phenylobacterium sp.]|nr:flagellar motor protein MotB [Phenylobacterium sp.]
MKTAAAILVAACLAGAGGALAQGAPAADATGAKAAPTPSTSDYTDALMNLDCPTCEGKVQSLRGFSLATPGAGASSAAPAAAARKAPARAATAHAPGVRLANTGPMPARVSAGDLRLTFRLGSAELTSEGEVNARSFAQALNDPRLAGASFQIIGHTDATGSAERNLILSRQRAEAVKSF